MLCVRNFPVLKKFMDKRMGLDSRFFVEVVLPKSTETLRRGTFLCCVSLKFR